ncbi:MAG: Holliday junction branch migration protein RuvA [Pseudomonadota bacterium]|nr:Holliday junction branch migration protein RuvA [Pseudomonadota bacterium]
MIGRLRGVLAETGEEDALVDVAGVGYVVRCGARTLARLPAAGDEVLLHVETRWAQDGGPTLYGFLGREERRVFTTLLAVQGVGPKAALAVLDVLPPAELASAVARDDRASVGRAQGVGPKLAQRIVVELKDKPLTGETVAEFHAQITAAPVHQPTVAGEAVSALLGLGVAEAVARRSVEQAVLRHGEDAEIGAVIKAALQELGR